jgi:ABC-type multidrug transport system ATPase subunit
VVNLSSSNEYLAWYDSIRTDTSQGFAQQADLHDPMATVREAFEFSALLRQPTIYSRAERLAYVDTILDLLDLRHVADAVIGDENSGLGVEMMKRVTVSKSTYLHAEVNEA